MADVNLQLVREFFELNMFYVFTNWQRDPSWQRMGEGGIQLFVENANPSPMKQPDFLLNPLDLSGIERAVVEIRAWHTDRFYPSVIENNPVLTQFIEQDALNLASDVFQGQPFTTILVISELPTSPEPRARSISLLRKAGIGHVLEFPAILQDLLDKVSVNANYTASPTLQTLRLLKRYKFTRNQQMEFMFPMEPPTPQIQPIVDTTEDPEDTESAEKTD